MKTIQMTLDESLVMEVDEEVKKLHTSRSAFTREALKKHLDYHRMLELEEKHRRGYKNHPASSKEFSEWEDEQVWVD
ncbi:MAG TPA: CopG family transcriptional regulator [Spirochaeta sp.]|nr:CopG family transcriptional regulator [Spirochaeta sp.]